MSIVKYGTAEAVPSTRAPSPIIWRDCPVGDFAQDPSKGSHMFDDFRNSGIELEEAARSAWTGGIGKILGDINWYGFTETALVADVALQADDEGVLMLDTDGTDDDTVGITSGDNVVGAWRSPKVGELQKLWFECRVKVNTITNTDLSWFIGLMEPGKLSNGSPLGAAPTAPADVDYVGFFVAEADGDDLTVIFNEASAGTAQSTTGLITLAADTYVRIGFKVTTNDSSIKIRFFKDGVDLGDAAAVDISTTNANWPGDTNMDVMITATSGATGEDGDNLKIDWVRIAQEF